MLRSQDCITYEAAKDKPTNLCTGDEILVAGPEHEYRCSTSRPCSMLSSWFALIPRHAAYIFSRYFPTQPEERNAETEEDEMERKQAEGKNKDEKN